jgi:hypothetical protein
MTNRLHGALIKSKLTKRNKQNNIKWHSTLPHFQF